MAAKDAIVAISVVIRQKDDGDRMRPVPQFQLKTRGGACRLERFRYGGIGFGAQLEDLQARYPKAQWDPYSRSRKGCGSWLVWLPTAAVRELAGTLAAWLLLLPWYLLVLPLYLKMAGYFGRPSIDMIGTVVILFLPVLLMPGAVRFADGRLTLRRQRISLRDLGRLPLELKSPQNRMDHA